MNRLTKLAILSMLLFNFPANASAAYPTENTQEAKNIFLAYTGYSADSDGTLHQQYWDVNDWKPIVTHMNHTTGKADGEMFTDILFTAAAVKGADGKLKYIGVSDKSSGVQSDWQLYKNELFLEGKNIDALSSLAENNDLGQKIKINVWISLPYPNAEVFKNDTRRIAAVNSWIDSFISTWNANGYGNHLNFAGFYWTGESEYASGPLINDSYVMSQVNEYIHKKSVDNHRLKSLWIPYQGATSWDRWKSFGFDLSILQNNYYFSPEKNFETGMANAYANGQGVEMELDLGVTWDSVSKVRFRKYMESGVTGGYDAKNRYFGPYMKEAPLAWYMGGWYWYQGARDHALLRLYRTGSPLYDDIWKFVNGSYQGKTVKN